MKNDAIEILLKELKKVKDEIINLVKTEEDKKILEEKIEEIFFETYSI